MVWKTIVLSFCLFLLMASKAQAGEPLLLKAESSLELTPSENGTLIKQNRSEIFLTADDTINENRNFFIIKSTAAIAYNYEEKGTSGKINISRIAVTKDHG